MSSTPCRSFLTAKAVLVVEAPEESPDPTPTRPLLSSLSERRHSNQTQQPDGVSRVIVAIASEQEVPPSPKCGFRRVSPHWCRRNILPLNHRRGEWEVCL